MPPSPNQFILPPPPSDFKDTDLWSSYQSLSFLKHCHSLCTCSCAITGVRTHRCLYTASSPWILSDKSVQGVNSSTVDPWSETTLMRDHLDQRPPSERPHWFKTIWRKIILMKDHPDQRPLWWETALMEDHWPWSKATLMKDITDVKPPLFSDHCLDLKPFLLFPANTPPPPFQTSLAPSLEWYWMSVSAVWLSTFTHAEQREFSDRKQAGAQLGAVNRPANRREKAKWTLYLGDYRFRLLVYFSFYTLWLLLLSLQMKQTEKKLKNRKQKKERKKCTKTHSSTM